MPTNSFLMFTFVNQGLYVARDEKLVYRITEYRVSPRSPRTGWTLQVYTVADYDAGRHQAAHVTCDKLAEAKAVGKAFSRLYGTLADVSPLDYRTHLHEAVSAGYADHDRIVRIREIIGAR